MYKVNFGSTELSVSIFCSKTLDEALIFAINLHRSSNMPHNISVLDDKDSVVVSLISK